MVLVIYGSGGTGREVACLARELNAQKKRWTEILFADDAKKNGRINGISVLSFDMLISEYPLEEIEFTIAVGEPAARKALFEKIVSHGGKMATLIHPTASVSGETAIADGVTVCAHASISCNVEIGENVYIQPHVYIGHDCRIGKHAVLSPCAGVAGNCEIGECAYVGMGSMVREGKRVGAWSILGMGAVLVRDMESGVVAVGNPAKVVKKNETRKVF